MPKRNEAKSLRESCMVTISIYFDLICYNCKNKKEMNQMLDNDSYLNIEGPFKGMPSSILSDMLDVIEGGNTSFHLRRKHLHALILPHIDTLKLPSSLGPNSFALDLILQRCKKLRRLDMSYLMDVNPTTLVKVIPNLTHLTVLNLKMTDILDQVLGLVGQHCVEIRELNISQCPITSSGLYSLCYDEETKKTFCTKLFRLNVVGCTVEVESIAFLVENVPSLRELEYENIFRVFNFIKNRQVNNSASCSPRVFHLNQLTSTDDAVSVECAEAAVNLCPFAVNVTISNSITTDEALYNLMLLQKLTHLRLTNTDRAPLDFYEGVLPVLTACGNKIESLLLTKFTRLDIIAIGESCPNLKNLAFSNIGCFEEILCARESLFMKLTALEIWAELQNHTLTSVILKQLMKYCPRLQNLLVSGSQALSDKLLAEVWHENPMRELSRITIENCHYISRISLDTLLNSENKLVLIRIWGCSFVTKEDSVTLQRRIKNENWDTYLDWYSWCGY